MTETLTSDKILEADLSIDKVKTLFIPIESLNTSRSLFVTTSVLLLIGLSYTLLGYYILPMIIAGTITEYTYLLLCLGLGLVWTLIGKLSSKYIRQYILTTKGEINKD